MVDGYCKWPKCDAPMDGDEFGMSLGDYSSKEAYMEELQDFHDRQYHGKVGD